MTERRSCHTFHLLKVQDGVFVAVKNFFLLSLSATTNTRYCCRIIVRPQISFQGGISPFLNGYCIRISTGHTSQMCHKLWKPQVQSDKNTYKLKH